MYLGRTFAVATTMLLITASAEAQADEAPRPAAPPPSATSTPAATAATAPGPVGIRTGAGFVMGNVNGTSLMRTDVSLGVTLDFTRWLTMYGDVHFGTTRFGYRGSLDDGLTVDGQLWSYFDVSVGAGAAVHALRIDPIALDVYGEFEGSVANTSPELESLRITTPQGNYDVGPYARNNSERSLNWYRLALGTTFRVRWGFAEPRFTLGFEHVHASMDVGLNPDSRDTLARLGYDTTRVEAPHEVSFFRVLLVPGVDFHMGPRDTLGLSGTIAPARDATTGGANLMYSHRF